MPDYTRSPAQRFNFKGMNTVLPPDSTPPGKYPLAVNSRAYLRDALTPRLPQSVSLLPLSLGAQVHSLRRMDDTTPPAITIVATGPNPCGTGADVPYAGVHTPWSNPGNITLEDGNFATCPNLSFGGVRTSDHLRATNFGFAIGGAVIITGILVEIKGFQTGPGSLLVTMLKAGVEVGASEGGPLPGANGFISFGSNLDLWGTAWTPGDINNLNFGVDIDAQNFNPPLSTFNIDFVRITVYGSTTVGPSAGFVFISGAADKVFVNSVQVASGMSSKRLAMVPFRPNTSVSPWMYIGDSAKLIKVRSDATTYQQGIKEPQDLPVLNAAGAGPITGSIFYAYKYRASSTGAVSNPSPTAHNQFFAAVANSIDVVCIASVDPQVDLIDIYRFGDVLDFTYVTTIQNSAPHFIDNLSAVAIANNPLMQIDDFEPFPSIDAPRKGMLQAIGVNVFAIGTVRLQWVSGDQFNPRWLGGSIITITVPGATQPSSAIVVRRPTTTIMDVELQPITAILPPATNLNFTVTGGILAAQPLPAFWGPTDNAAFMFACGDPLRPGTLYFTKGNNPDSAPDTNSIEVTSPAEPLIGGCIVGGLSLVLSGERGWLIYPNFAQATATIVGVAGSPFTVVESIADRGLFTKEGICTDGGGNAYFIAKDSIRKSPAGVGSQSITDDLYNLFPHEGGPQQVYFIAGFTVQPPDYSQPDGMALRFAQGYVYFDYIGRDNIRHTLVYDVDNEAWGVDLYGVVAGIHSDNPGAFISPGPAVPLGPIMGCNDGTVRQLSPTSVEAFSQMTIVCPTFDGGDARATKHFGDIYLESVAPISAFTLDLWTDRYTVSQFGNFLPTTFPGTASGVRQGSIIDLVAGVGIYGMDIAPVINISVNQVGAVLYLWQPSYVLQPETIGERYTDWYDGGNNGAKFIQGVIVEADTANFAKQFSIQSADDLLFNTLVEVGAGVVFGGRSKKAFSVAVPFVAHSVRLASQDIVPWRVWGVEFIYVPYPELAREWHTENTSHGFKGFQHIGEINIPHISTADITLTLVPDFGAPVVVVVPNSAGKQLKTLVTIPAFKFKLVGYNFSSTAAFRLWKEDVEVKVKAWGDSGPYQIVRPFGGESAAQALV